MRLEEYLTLDRCPHCGVNRPSLIHLFERSTADYRGYSAGTWAVYSCGRCGKWVMVRDAVNQGDVTHIYPTPMEVDTSVPSRAAEYLRQAINSLHAPSGSIMLSASAVDAMLKEKGYKEGSLYGRIDKAADDHLITKEMAEWAHAVRLKANDERHADDHADLPTEEEARRSVEFVQALAKFLFELPAMVAAGIKRANESAT